MYEALILGKKCVCFSHTGELKNVLDQYGYVLYGDVNLERLVDFLPKILGPNNEMKISEKVVEKIRNKYDINTKMKKLENMLLKLVEN